MDTNGNYIQSQIQNQFCSYEIALKLKELGFDKECLMWYCHENNLTDDLIFKQYKEEDYFCNAPLWQQVIDWFREEYNIIIYIFSMCAADLSVDYHCKVNFIIDGIWEYVYPTKEMKLSYEEARKQAILKCIELLKNK